MNELFDCKLEVWRTSDVERYCIEHGAPLDDFTQPSSLALASDQHLLLIPLQKGKSPRSFAVGFIITDRPEIFVRLAKSSIREWEATAMVEELSTEREGLIRQLTLDFEELTFFRNVAPKLSQKVKSKDVALLADTVFQMVNVSLRAGMLVFFRRQPEDKSLIKVASFGPDPVPVSEVTRLMKDFDNGGSQIEVVNNLESVVAGGRYDSIKNFILIPVTHQDDVIGWVLALNREVDEVVTNFARSESEFGSSEATILNSAAKMLASYVVNIDMLNDREALLTNVVFTLVSTIEAKDAYTCGHSERVARYGRHLAERAGYDSESLERIYLSGLLHDIGKIGIPDSILRKPDGLTEREFEIIKRHPSDGWDILNELKELSYVRDGVLFHHENLDGSGYPHGLKGDEIPVDGRILAIADAFDAMTSDRPYRKGMSYERALKIIENGAGTQWDEQLVKIFVESFDELLLVKQDDLPTLR